MAYLGMGLTWVAEFLMLLPVIQIKQSAGYMTYCLAAGMVLWVLEWQMAGEAFDVPECGNREACGSCADRAKRAVLQPDMDKSGVLLFIPGFWALLAQAAVSLRFAADLLSDVFWPGVSAAFLCPAVFIGTVLLTVFCKRKGEKRAYRDGTGRLTVIAAAFAAVSSAAAGLTVYSRAAEENGLQELAVTAAAAFSACENIPLKRMAVLLLLTGLLFSSAVSYLGLQRILSALVPCRARRAASGFWPVCIIIPLLLAVGFRGRTSLAGWYAAYSIFILAPFVGIFSLLRLYCRIKDC